jgi:hypothetical protein
MKRLAALLAIVFITTAAAACTSGTQNHSTPTQSGGTPTDSPDALLERVEAAIRHTSGYTVEVTGHNFVLPRWGGIDGATVEIATTGATATARLDRTGDGSYELTIVDAGTYFKRSTCSHLTRVPGGGGEVLTPFLIGTNGYLTKATDLSMANSRDPGRFAVAGTFSDFGAGIIEIDAASFLPTMLSSSGDASNGSESTWRFTNWGTAPKVSSPAGDIAENGPGGNPC